MDGETVPNMPRPRIFRRRGDIDRADRAGISGESELRAAMEAAGLGIFDYYPLSGELQWNNPAKDHFGLSPDAHVNYNAFLVGLHPDDRRRVNALMQNALKRDNDGEYAAEFRTIGIEDERERWISMRGRAFFNSLGEAVRFTGTTLDITGSKRNEEKLRESREHWRLLFEKSPLPKWIVDFELMSFLDVNDAAVERFGYSLEEFKEMSLADICASEELEKFRNRLKERFSPGQTVEGPALAKHRKKDREGVDAIAQSTEILYKGRRALLTVVTEPAR
jgi:PAS domain S-box-containing protein